MQHGLEAGHSIGLRALLASPPSHRKRRVRVKEGLLRLWIGVVEGGAPAPHPTGAHIPTALQEPCGPARAPAPRDSSLRSRMTRMTVVPVSDRGWGRWWLGPLDFGLVWWKGVSRPSRAPPWVPVFTGKTDGREPRSVVRWFGGRGFLAPHPTGAHTPTPLQEPCGPARDPPPEIFRCAQE